MCALKRRFGSLKWPDSNLKPDYIAKSACQLDFQVPERQERFAIAARQFSSANTVASRYLPENTSERTAFRLCRLSGLS